MVKHVKVAKNNVSVNVIFFCEFNTMASADIDEFVLNFDLNHLNNEANIQTLEQKYEKLRKSMSWLKSRIISTDFAIQKYQNKKDDYDQSVKAHSATSEELKQTCINYKNASEKCVALENENKLLLAKHEGLKERVIDLETQYSALICHTNQLQVLIKNLENEKDALKVEIELDKCDNKARNQDVVMLQKEKQDMLNDLIILKDLILGKKKIGKKHIKLLKKYGNESRSNGSKILCTSEESGDDIDMYSDICSPTQTHLNKTENVANDELILSIEQHFIDNYSDSSNEKESVDTGRGSSLANSQDTYTSSPDYIFKNVVKKIDAINSPIIMYPPRSVATSPIIIDEPASVFEDNYDDYTDCLDSPDYINDDVPLSENTNMTQEQNKFAVFTVPKLKDTGTSPIKNYENLILKDAASNSQEKALLIEANGSNESDQQRIFEKEISKYLCENSDTSIIEEKIKFIDACTSPVSITTDYRKLNKRVNLNKSDKYETCEKSTSTDIVTKPDFVDAYTSTIPKSRDFYKFVDKATNTVNKMDRSNHCDFCEPNNPISRCCKKSMCANITLTEKKIDACTNTDLIPFKKYITLDKGKEIPFKEQNEKSKKSVLTDQEIKEQNEKSTKTFLTDQEQSLVNNKKTSSYLNKKSDSKFRDKSARCPVEELRTQEKLCLENNSSKNLHFEANNDTEIQNILNVMKLHHDLITPISKTPNDSQYLELIPQMNCTLTKIYAAIKNMCRMTNQLPINSETNSLNHLETNEIEEISEVIDKRSFEQQQLGFTTRVNSVVDDDIIDITSRSNSTSGISADNTESSNVIELDGLKSDMLTNKILPQSKTGEINLKEHKNREKVHSKQEDILNDTGLNEICEGNKLYTNDTEICNTVQGPIARTIIINGTRTKKKSKLQAFRNKLLPICKIKKMIPSIKKHSLKSYNFKPKDISSSLNQKLAYDKAVKVMAELRAKPELQGKTKTLRYVNKDSNVENKSSKLDSSSEIFESKMLSTRSRTRRLNKKEETAVIGSHEKSSGLDQSVNIDKDIVKVLGNVKGRKRPADTEVDRILEQSPCKRILRSSRISQATDGKYLPISHHFDLSANAAEEMIVGSKQNNECTGHVKNVNYSDGSVSLYQNVNQDNCNPNNQTRELVELTKSNVSFETSTVGKMKPVVEISKCLADNANAISIVPGDADYLDVNKNIHQSKKSAAELDSYNNMHGIESNNLTLDQSNLRKNDKFSIEKKSINNNHHSEKGFKNTKTLQNEESEVSMETENISSISLSRVLGGVEDNATNIVSVEMNSLVVPPTTIEQCATKSIKLKALEDAVIDFKEPVVKLIPLKNNVHSLKNKIVNYSDLDLYTAGNNKISNALPSENRKENILCGALDRYGVISIKYAARKVPDSVTFTISQKIEESITNIIASPSIEQKPKMKDLVNYIQNFKTKHILAGLMKYLKDPTRKNELFNKIVNGAAPPMTKPEAILLYVIESLNESLSSGFIYRIWNTIEHALFQLNRSPEFGVIESMSHFYAVLCRYFRNKSRLRCFMLDAMYCLQFKAVPLIRQCLDVCPGVLPNAHEHMAKTSLVTCLVYLLHFYKCKDKFNRAQDVRNILYRKYQYRFSEWNETMILEIFRKAIMDLRGTHNDKKMLRVALIILCKRHGAKWCQLNIIQNMLLPIIEKKDVPERIKQFCVLMLGPLLKPFPADKKAQCEIVISQLLLMLKQNTSHEMKEAIYSSLIFMNKHDQERVVQALLSWNPESVSSHFKEILNDYVMEKPLAVWKKLVTRRPSQCT